MTATVAGRSSSRLRREPTENVEVRPYKRLRRDAMASVDERVDAVAAHLLQSERLDRGVVDSLWGICHFVRVWALHADGMLQSNSLIDKADAAELDAWVIDLSYRVSMLLDGCEEGIQRSPDGASER